jgi:hypothetical protein
MSPQKATLVLLAAAAAGAATAVVALRVWDARRPPRAEPVPPLTAAPAPLPTPGPSQTPTATVEPTAPAAEAPTPQPAEASPPAPLAARTPVPPRPAASAPASNSRIPGLLAQAAAESAAGRPESAAAAYDAVLALDPKQPAAQAGKAAALATAAALRRSFSFGVGSAERREPGGGSAPRGFESDGMDVRHAAQVPGRVDFEVTPARVKPGDSFTVRVYLVNTGKKEIGVQDLVLVETVNGKTSAGPAAVLAAQVPTRQRALVGMRAGTWAADASSWTLEARVASDRGDVYRNLLAWK